MKRFVLLSLFLGLMITGVFLLLLPGRKDPKLASKSNGESVQQEQWTRECPPEGTARTERMRILNRKKNRIHFPGEADFDLSITLDKILMPGDDALRWSEEKAVRITAYVIDIKPGGKETCNCGAKDMEDRDTHIDLVGDPMDPSKDKRLVAEVTPPMRSIMKKKGVNWSTRSLRDQYLGRWVEIEGWLFFDEEHDDESENTRPGRERNWRATAWEIHPLTSIRVIDRPR